METTPSMDTPDREVLTVAEVASFLRISRASAYEAIRTGEIPSFKIGRSIRVSRSALLAWIDHQSGKDLTTNSPLMGVDFSPPAGAQTH